jgi:hypothetical protein
MLMKPKLRLPVALLALSVAATPLQAQATDYAEDLAAIKATIHGANGKSVAGARLLAYHLSSERVFVSEPTKSNGECGLRDLPYGYHDLAVETDEGLFVASGVINVPPATTSVIVLTLHPAVGESAGRGFPGSEMDTVGMAELLERVRGRAFWKSPRGIAVLGGAGAVSLLLLAGKGNDSSETNASDF